MTPDWHSGEMQRTVMPWQAMMMTVKAEEVVIERVVESRAVRCPQQAERVYSPAGGPERDNEIGSLRDP